MLPAVGAVALVLLLAASSSGAPLVPTLGATDQVDPDSVLLSASVNPDGDADWEVRYRLRLDDENATAAFESLEADVRENRSAYAGRFEDRMGRTVTAAENATGREMALRNVTVRTTRQDIGQRYGVLIYAFEWTNFAAANETTLVVGDAIGGLFLDEETALTIQWPAGYAPARVDPAPAETGDRSVTWRGPADFSADQPRVVASTTAAGEPTPAGADVPVAAIGVAVLLVLVAGAAAVVWRRRDAGAPSAGESDELPEELLSNEERVLRLLRENGGRMKQQQVVEALGWTDAKTSQVVGELRESGRVEGFRLGRENVLRLPEDDEA